MIGLLAALSSASARDDLPTEFAIEHRAGLIWLRVNVASATEPLNFLLDSGAGVSVINLRTAKRLGVKLGRRVEVRGVQSVTQGYWPQRLSARVNDVPMPKEYLAVDLHELSRACNCCVDGLLGADFFREHIVQIDFAALKVRLLRQSEATGGEVLRLKDSGRSLLAPVRVNGGKVQWMRLDTGCAAALEWVVQGARPVGGKKTVSVGLSELSIPEVSTRVTLGHETFDQVPTGLHSPEIFSGEAGLLGNNLLSRFQRVTIDAKARLLILQDRRADR